MAGRRGGHRNHAWDRRGWFEPLECRRLLNAAPVGEPERFVVFRGELVETSLNWYTAVAPGVLANDEDPDGDPLQAVLLSADDQIAVQLQPDGSFDVFWKGGSIAAQFTYAVTDSEQISTPIVADLWFGGGSLSNVAYWPEAEGGNGHTYVRHRRLELEEASVEALLEASGSVRYLDTTGHLATLTTPDENEFIEQQGGLFSGRYIFGAYQDRSAEDYEEPAGGWRWVTGEPWDYTNWRLGEPNEFYDSREDVAEIHADPHIEGGWNDIRLSTTETVLLEFENPGAFPGDDSYRLPLVGEFVVKTEELLRNDVLGRPGFSLEIVEPPLRGTVEIDATGLVRYLPDSHGGEPYRERFTYRLVNGDYASSIASVWLKVGEDDWPTVAKADGYYVDPDEGLVLEVDGYRWPTVLANDVDQDGAPLMVVLERAPDGGELDLQPDGRFRFTPAEEFRGRTTFSYVATDGISRSDVTEVVIEYRDYQIKNVALPDIYEYTPGQILSVVEPSGLLSNDIAYGEPGYRTTALTVVTTAGGHASVSADGSFDYVPPPGYAGPDHFNYTASRFDREIGRRWNTVQTYVHLAVNGALIDPVAAADTYVLDHSGAVTTEASTGVTANDVGSESGWSVRLVEGPRQGVLRLASDGTFAYRAFERDPLATIADRFTYQFYDGERSLEPVEVQLTRDALPEAIRVAWPDAPGDPDREYLVILDDIEANAWNKSWFFADTLANSYASSGRQGHLLTITSPEEQAFVAETLLPLATANERIWLGARQDFFDPQSPEEWNWVTGESFDFMNWVGEPERGTRFNDFAELHVQGLSAGEWEAGDWHRGIDLCPLVIEFSQFSEPARPRAEASDDAYYLQNGSTSIVAEEGLLANDNAPSDNLTVQLVEGPATGSLQWAEDGSFSYTSPDAAAADSFTYQLVDGDWRSESATVWLNVNPQQASLAAEPDAYRCVWGSALRIEMRHGVLANDVLAEGAVAVLESAPSHGTVELADDGGFIYVPAPDYIGEDVFHYLLQDANTRTEAVAVYLDIRAPFETAVVFVEEPTSSPQLDTLPSSVETISVGENVVAELWVRHINGFPGTQFPDNPFNATRQSVEFDAARLQAMEVSTRGSYFEVDEGPGPVLDEATGRVEGIRLWPPTVDAHLGDDWARVVFTTFETTSTGVATAMPTVEFPLSVDPSFADRLDVPTSMLRITSPADFNRDGAVDLADFATLKSSFGQSGTAASGDANRDGSVDLLDFVLMKHDFGFRIE